MCLTCFPLQFLSLSLEELFFFNGSLLWWLMFPKSPRCQVVPLPQKQVAFVVDGQERLRWHAAEDAPRPFFFPLTGPSGLSLTRMGHPGAPNHDHHRSIWFAHNKVLGIDFWSDTSDAVIRQEQWLAYQSGQDEASMAVELGWYDGHDPAPLLKQKLVTAIAPADNNGVVIEIQTTLNSVAESLELEQTNFGLLAVRVADSISAVFGDGILTGSNGLQTEKQLFEKASAWMDYSGSVDAGTTEGLTYFDHPQNASYPSKWHVRDDGWLGASVCGDSSVMLYRDQPTTWRYLIHAHAGPANVEAANHLADAFNRRPPFAVRPAKKPHHKYLIERESNE